MTAPTTSWRRPRACRTRSRKRRTPTCAMPPATRAAASTSTTSTRPSSRRTGLEFDKETVDSFELGLKGNYLDGRLALNLAAFIANYDDYQVNGSSTSGAAAPRSDQQRREGRDHRFRGGIDLPRHGRLHAAGIGRTAEGGVRPSRAAARPARRLGQRTAERAEADLCRRCDLVPAPAGVAVHTAAARRRDPHERRLHDGRQCDHDAVQQRLPRHDSVRQAEGADRAQRARRPHVGRRDPGSLRVGPQISPTRPTRWTSCATSSARSPSSRACRAPMA